MKSLRSLVHLSICCLAFNVFACAAPLSNRAKLDDAVQEMNTAARFGRTDIANEHVLQASKSSFIKQHKGWGGNVQVVDVEFGSVEKYSDKEAVLLIQYGWYRPTEGRLRTTLVRQTWQNDSKHGGWGLSKEERASGDIGLLGENHVVLRPSQTTKHFETKVLGTDD